MEELSNEELYAPKDLKAIRDDRRTSRSRNSSVVDSLTNHERPLPPQPPTEASYPITPSKTPPIYRPSSIDRTSISYSNAATVTTLTGPHAHKLTTMDVRRIHDLLNSLKDVRDRQGVIDKRFGDRIEWLKEKERGAELKARARR
jgi:hypothetical protein